MSDHIPDDALSRVCNISNLTLALERDCIEFATHPDVLQLGCSIADLSMVCRSTAQHIFQNLVDRCLTPAVLTELLATPPPPTPTREVTTPATPTREVTTPSTPSTPSTPTY